MGAFFARNAVNAETPNWKTKEVELGFDTDLGGSLNLITVQGVGLIRIDFERVE
jgi:flagellar basal body rod protein FlgB